jgi:hypothetical protein
MRYTSKELAILRVIAKEKAKGLLVIPMDTIVDETEKVLDPNSNQVNFRSGVAATVRNLQRKVGELGITLAPNGKVGRGHKMMIAVTGDFKQAIQRLEEGLSAKVQGEVRA